MKAIKFISWFLGITMFLFGILKVIIPTINGWYSVQMTKSGIGEFIPIWVGITGEIVVGLALIIGLLTATNKNFKIVMQLTSAAIVAIMATAIYVHLQPNVPAEVLPLKIKPPVIPAFLMVLAFINIYLTQRKINKTS